MRPRRLQLRAPWMLEIRQKPPPCLLLPALLAPLVRRLGEQVDDAGQALVVRDRDKHTLVRVEDLELVEGPVRLVRVEVGAVVAVAGGDGQEGLGAGAALRVEVGEDRAGAGVGGGDV